MQQSELCLVQEKLRLTRQDCDEWKTAHKEIAGLLGAVARGRDHCDSLIAISAIKQAFHIESIAVMYDASEVLITLEDGSISHVLIAPEEIT